MQPQPLQSIAISTCGSIPSDGCIAGCKDHFTYILGGGPGQERKGNWFNGCRIQRASFLLACFYEEAASLYNWKFSSVILHHDTHFLTEKTPSSRKEKRSDLGLPYVWTYPEYCSRKQRPGGNRRNSWGIPGVWQVTLAVSLLQNFLSNSSE